MKTSIFLIIFLLCTSAFAEDNILVRRNYRGYNTQPRSVVVKRAVAIEPLKKNYSLILDKDGNPVIIPTEDLKQNKRDYCLINCGP